MMLHSTIKYFPTALLIASLWAAAFARTLHVDSTSDSEIADGTHSHPFSSLSSAWKFIAANPADTTEIRLAGGIYILPNSQHILKDVFVNHSPENRTQPVILRQNEDSATSDEPPLYARGTAKIKFRSLSFEGPKMNAPSSSSKWALMHSGDSSSIELHECEIKGVGPESFVRFIASDSSTLTVNTTLVQDTAFQITTLDNSTLVNSNLIVKNTTVKDRAIFDFSGNSTISFQNSTFNNNFGLIFALTDGVQADLSSIEIIGHSCANASTVGIVSTQRTSSAKFQNATVKGNDGSLCSAGLIASYDNSTITLETSQLRENIARIAYLDGNSSITFKNTSVHSNVEVDTIGHIFSSRSSAKLSFVNTTAINNIGALIAVDKSSVSFQYCNLQDNICPPTKSYVISVVNSAQITLTNTAVKSKRREKACVLVDGTDDSGINMLNVSVKGHFCRSSCISAISGASLSFERINIAESVVFDGGRAIISVASNKRHSFSNIDLIGNYGESQEVPLVGINVLRSNLSIAGIMASDNELSTIISIDESSAVNITNSTFRRNFNQFTKFMGGAITSRGNLSVSNSTFNSNIATRGGAIFHSTRSLNIDGCQFKNNTALADGGALYFGEVDSSFNIKIYRSVFQSNVAKRGGAWFTSTVSLEPEELGNTYRKNVASDQGKDKASSFTNLKLASNVPSGFTYLAGDSVMEITVDALDRFAQKYNGSRTDSVLLVQAVVTDINGNVSDQITVQGEVTKAIFNGSATFKDLTVFGKPGSYFLTFARLVDMKNIDTLNTVSIPLTIDICPPGKALVPSPKYGHQFQSCMPIICNKGCSSAGVCVSLNNCTCLDTEWEGIACELRQNSADSIIFNLPANRFPVSTLSRDAIIDQLTTVLPPNLQVAYRSMKQSSQDIVEFKFSVFENSTGYYVQETDLVALKIKIHEELMKIDFHMEDNIADQNAFTASVSNVEKLTVKGGSVIGLAVTVVTTVSMLVAILQYTILVKYRNHDVVKTAGLSFLTLMTVAMICIYPVLFTSIGDPTRVKCSIEVILASIGVGLSTSVLLCRAIHIYLTCDNEIVCKSAIPKHLFTRYIAVVCASLLYNVLVTSTWLYLDPPVPTFISSSSSAPYAVCAPYRSLYVSLIFSFNFILILCGLYLSFTCRFGYSMSQEPRFLLLIYCNGLLCGGLMLGLTIFLKNMGFEMMLIIKSVIVLSVLGAWSCTFLGYKVYLILFKTEGESNNMLKPTKKVATENSHSLFGHIDHTNVLAVGLVPLRMADKQFMPWRYHLLEVAKDYGYVAITRGNESIYHSLPCQLIPDKFHDLCLRIEFSDGHCYLLQAKDTQNLQDWIRVISGAVKPEKIEKSNEEDIEHERREYVRRSSIFQKVWRSSKELFEEMMNVGERSERGKLPPVREDPMI